jgi:hypothetical protein
MVANDEADSLPAVLLGLFSGMARSTAVGSAQPAPSHEQKVPTCRILRDTKAIVGLWKTMG